MVIDQVEYYSQVRARRVEWLWYADGDEVIDEFTKDKYGLTYTVKAEKRVRLCSKLYVKEKEYENTDILNRGADRSSYDLSCFIGEIL